MPMGFDWESILGTSGAGLADAYDQAVSTVVYDQDQSDGGPELPFEEN